MIGPLLDDGDGVPGLLFTDCPDAIIVGTATLSLLNDGTYTASGDAGGNWVTPAVAAVAALYQVKVDVTSGALTSGTTGSWLDLSITRSWACTTGEAAGVTLSIREKATGIVRFTETDIAIVGDV